ncbi:hypothetical protein MJM59_31655, partial [Salmonella enterica subsp. enterica serovar Montevideo]|nr:hypothetical protein [Salmonella enterica subsp. enterica serovar Montevideo]
AGINLNDLGFADPTRNITNTWLDWVSGAAVRQGLPAKIERIYASINMIRKHATSREFKGNVSTEYGSWNKQRYVMDLQSPLTAD